MKHHYIIIDKEITVFHNVKYHMQYQNKIVG